MMKLFHLFTVTPVEVESHELPRVEMANYLLQALSLEDAWEKLKGRVGIAEAPEVWGAVYEPVLDLGPDYQPRKQERADQHTFWCREQEHYRRLHEGPESLEQWQTRRFAERYPQFA